MTIRKHNEYWNKRRKIRSQAAQLITPRTREVSCNLVCGSLNLTAEMGLMGDGDPDLANRDPKDINDHVNVQFEEVLGEPDGIHSLDCVWKLSYKCFNLWKNLCYIIMTTLCGLCIAACWGCEFAFLAFHHIWTITPCYRMLEITALSFKRFVSVCVHCVCDPCCEACGLIFAAFGKN